MSDLVSTLKQARGADLFDRCRNKVDVEYERLKMIRWKVGRRYHCTEARMSFCDSVTPSTPIPRMQGFGSLSDATQRPRLFRTLPSKV